MTGKIDLKLILKLTIWSFIVGVILYSLNLSPGEIYGWMGDTLAGLWDWLVKSGLQYILLGATIVVPIYLIMHFRDRSRKG